MSKPTLIDEELKLEHELIETFLAGHHQYRPDLPYPESHSDMAGGVRALMQMFKIERRPLSEPLHAKCDFCKGLGEYIMEDEPHHFTTKHCWHCDGNGSKEIL